MSKRIYTPKFIRSQILHKSQQEIAKRLKVSRPQYSRMENFTRSWSLDVAIRYKEYILTELEKLPTGAVDWDCVPDLEDINKMNNKGLKA